VLCTHFHPLWTDLNFHLFELPFGIYHEVDQKNLFSHLFENRCPSPNFGEISKFVGMSASGQHFVSWDFRSYALQKEGCSTHVCSLKLEAVLPSLGGKLTHKILTMACVQMVTATLIWDAICDAAGGDEKKVKNLCSLLLSTRNSYSAPDF
jgi:hypothetical protein